MEFVKVMGIKARFAKTIFTEKPTPAGRVPEWYMRAFVNDNPTQADFEAAERNLLAWAEKHPEDTKEDKSMNKPEIVCLCGPLRFMDAFRQAEYDFEMQGAIVVGPSFLPGATTHDGTTGCTPEQKIMLDNLHKRKIYLCDKVFVLNVGGYIGESTKSEIAYAQKIGKPVEYLERLLRYTPEQVKVMKWLVQGGYTAVVQNENGEISAHIKMPLLCSNDWSPDNETGCIWGNKLDCLRHPISDWTVPLDLLAALRDAGEEV